MTPTDVKALKPGQGLLVKARLIGIQSDGEAVQVGFSNLPHTSWHPSSAIHSVLPDPIKVGDRVKCADGDEGIVVDVCGSVSCVRLDQPSSGRLYCEPHTDSLERI